MLRFKWHFCYIENVMQANDMVKLFNETDHDAGAFDTETTGLSIILDKPFLYQFGWITSSGNGYAFAVDLERHPALARQVIAYWQKYLASTLPIYLGHNVKYDLSMMCNIGLPYSCKNVSDSMFYIRYAHDNLTPENGGPPMKLKPYASRYIDMSARTHEKLLDQEKSAIAKELNVKLRNRIRKRSNTAVYNSLAEMFKDPTFEISDLPAEIRNEYVEWLNNDVPSWLKDKIITTVEADMIPYNRLNRENVIRYAMYDIVWTLEIWAKLHNVVVARQNTRGLEIENQLIYPLLEMERVGFLIDVDYLRGCKVKMRDYIRQQRQALYESAGEVIKVGQHARIKQLLQERFGETVSGTDNSTLETLKSELIRSGHNPDCVRFIELLSELRTLEKWYAVYILRFLKDLKTTDRLYTTINQVGTVSGRVTSDFQQFPKDAIKTEAGEELFQPRKMIRVTGGDYTSIVYLDFSQIELRFQALYTILVGHPDLNLCRAYMPYECVNKEGVKFDCQNPEHVKHWDAEWFFAEDPTKPWVPTDVHGATTKLAFGIDESDPRFHRLRYEGKRVNFSKNYGATYKKICEMFPDRTPEECHRIDNAYYAAFPGVKTYHEYCYSRAQFAYTVNLFGIRYYGVSGHKLINMLVQGSAAYYLKLKIIELYNYSKERHIKTRWQMQIHDELSWERYRTDPPELFFEYQRIMQDWPDGFVPLVAEMEVTNSSWAEKVEVKTVDQLQHCFSA